MSPIEHTAQVRVRYADTDKMGVVYNGVYLQYFEIGRTELLRSMGLPYVMLEEMGFQLPLLEAHVEYKAPARYDQLIDIITSYHHNNTVATITLSYHICFDDRTLATGYTRHSFVDSVTWRPVRPPSVFRDAVTRALKQPA